MGRQAHKPTDQSRRQVETLSGYGVPQDQIAVLTGCDPKTLRKWYAEELERGNAKATAAVAQTLYQRATGTGKDALAAAIFWLKARAGWREVQRTEVTGADGEALAHGVMVVPAAISDWDKQAKATMDKVLKSEGDA